MLRAHEDKAVIVSFDTAAELVADLTDDIEKLTGAIRGLRPGGGTAMYDAIFFACRDKLMQDQPRFKFRRAMVILSDGEDNQSRWTRDQALEMAHKADVVMYSISTNRSGTETDGDKVLKYFADQTGGQAFFPFKAQDLAQILRKHRERAASSIQRAVSSGAAQDGRSVSPRRREGAGSQGPGGPGPPRLLRTVVALGAC